METSEGATKKGLRGLTYQSFFRRRVKTLAPLDTKAFAPDRYEVDPERHYDIDKSGWVGEGGYGSVFVAYDKVYGGRTVAIKKVTKKDERHCRAFREEMSILKQLDHPNVCKLFETFEVRDFMFFVMEFCEGGELFDRIVQSQCFCEAMAADIAKQVVSALHYAHRKGIAHRDLKPENICFCSTEASDTRVKVIDWGLGRIFGDSTMNTSVGSLNYSAPEVITSSAEDLQTGYTDACDLWSLGVVTYIMLSGRPPFWGSEQKMLRNMLAAKYPLTGESWDHISAEGRDWIRRLLQPSPAERLTSDDALAHPWLEKRSGVEDPEVSRRVLANLKLFEGVSVFFSLCAASVARQLDHHQLQDIHKVFRDLDTDGDGVLSFEEVREGFKRIHGKEPSHLEELFRSADLDGSGVIDYTEFCAAGMGRRRDLQEDVLWAAFRSFDGADEGHITRDTLTRILAQADVQQAFTPALCEQVAAQIVEKYDRDGNGAIDFPEWVELMRAKSTLSVSATSESSRQPEIEPSDRAFSGVSVGASSCRSRSASAEARALSAATSARSAYKFLSTIGSEGGSEPSGLNSSEARRRARGQPWPREEAPGVAPVPGPLVRHDEGCLVGPVPESMRLRQHFPVSPAIPGTPDPGARHAPGGPQAGAGPQPGSGGSWDWVSRTVSGHIMSVMATAGLVEGEAPGPSPPSASPLPAAAEASDPDLLRGFSTGDVDAPPELRW